MRDACRRFGRYPTQTQRWYLYGCPPAMAHSSWRERDARNGKDDKDNHDNDNVNIVDHFDQSGWVAESRRRARTKRTGARTKRTKKRLLERDRRKSVIALTKTKKAGDSWPIRVWGVGTQ